MFMMGCRDWVLVRRWGSVFLLLLPLLASGCSASPGAVSGQVTFNGQGLPLGTITFHCQSGNHDVISALIRDGAYSAPAVCAGANKVTVISTDPARAGGALPEPAAVPASDVAAPVGENFAPNYVVIPERYADPDQSGLSLEVRSGPQTFNVELTP
jgi:hypothetical protein